MIHAILRVLACASPGATLQSKASDYCLLLVDDDPEMLELLALGAESVFQGKILIANSPLEAIELIKSGNRPRLIVSDFEMQGTTGADLFHMLAQQQYTGEFAICSGSDPHKIRAALPQLKHLIAKPLVIKPLQALIKSLQLDQALPTEAKSSTSEPRYVGIRLTTLMRLGHMDLELYVKLSDNKFVKIADKGSEFDAELLSRYSARDVSHLYLTETEARKFAEALEQNLAFLSENTELSDDAVLGLAEEATAAVDNLVRTLGWEPHFQKIAIKATKIAANALAKNRELAKSWISLRKNPDRYLASHSQMLSLVACNLAQNMGWASEVTLTKIALAAFMHDLSLGELSYAEIQKGDEIACATQAETTNLKLYRNHPLAAEAMVLAAENFPPEVAVILRQHHERPDGSGYPQRIEARSVTPLAALFIVAHEFIDATWNQDLSPAVIEQFCQAKENYFDKGIFRKALACLSARAK